MSYTVAVMKTEKRVAAELVFSFHLCFVYVKFRDSSLGVAGASLGAGNTPSDANVRIPMPNLLMFTLSTKDLLSERGRCDFFSESNSPDAINLFLP